MRAPAGRPIKVQVVFEGDDGHPVSASGVTWTVADGAGQTSEPAPAQPGSNNTWTATIPARDRLDRLAVTFTGTVSDFEHRVKVTVDVVDQRLVPLHRLQAALHDAAPAFYDAAPADPVMLRRAADAAEDWIDDALGYPAVRRAIRARFRLTGGPFLRPPGVIHPGDLYELEVGGREIDVSMATGFDRFAWERFDGSPWPVGPARIWATHGLDEPPEDLRRAAVVLARYLARTSKVPERAASVTTDSTLIVFSRPDTQKPTGLPEVDAVIARRRIETHL